MAKVSGKEEGYVVTAVKDILSGTIGGIGQVIAGHPLGNSKTNCL